MESWFKGVATAEPIEVFSLIGAHAEDPDPNKVNLSAGAYRTDEGKPWVLPVVKAVENQMAADTSLNHEYLPVAGLPGFRDNAAKLLLGENSQAIAENRVDGIQAIGGTGAIRVGLDFLKNVLGCSVVYASDPTWGNHNGIAKSLKYPEVRKYPYWDGNTRSLNFAAMTDALRTAPERSVILLHMVAHNPTGVDPTREQWMELATIVKEKKLFPFFDCAYQGFATGDLEADAWPIRYFVEQGFTCFGAQSFSKNFGLYNERVGCLTFIAGSPEEKVAVRSQLMLAVRQTWSNSPNHGGRVVATVLNNPALLAEWKDNVRTMADRIKLMRQELYNRLRALGTPGTWEHIISQIGMFSFTGLNQKQSEQMVRQYHIYMLKNGRINMCGLTSKNLDYVAQSIDAVVREADQCQAKV